MTDVSSLEESIFCAAIEIEDETERRRFVADRCGQDANLRQRVVQLLRMHASDGRILDATTVGDAKSESDTVAMPRPGQEIGPYKLLQEIGEGGMGVVFMAEQQAPVRRKVALKIIKVGMDTRRVVARFESERQALALMEHPCITKVFDAGSTRAGRPYFVMELVRGMAITDYCDEKQLSVRRRLEIFEQVCHAVEHAHQKGIIHRDIKPTNIMVTSNDGLPLPKIIDFGIAKATGDRLTDKTLFTNYGEMIGTPLYMSPEQAEMSEPDVDTRSDIYSLGVLLYELLTGTTPFADLKKSSFHAIRDAIRSRDPQFASTRVAALGETLRQAAENRGTDGRNLHRFLRGDLDWILCRCLNRQRSERYQSAGELAREIRRYLKGESVDAAAPTLMYRSRKFAARHKAAVLIAACLVFVLVGSSLFSGYMAMRANQLAKEARAAQILALKQRDQIAELERQQHELAAINEAAANYNAQLLKREFERQYRGLKTSDNPKQLKIQSLQQISRNPDSGSGSPWPFKIGWPLRIQNDQAPAAAQTDIAQSDLQQQRSRSQPEIKIWSPRDGNQHFMQGPQNNNAEIVLIAGDENNCKTEFWRQVLEVQIKEFGPHDPVVAQTLTRIGESLFYESKFPESEKIFREALAKFENRQVEDKVIRDLRLNLAKSLSQQGKAEQAQVLVGNLEKEMNLKRLNAETIKQIKQIKQEILDLQESKKDLPNK